MNVKKLAINLTQRTRKSDFKDNQSKSIREASEAR